MLKLNTLVVFLVLALLRHANSQTFLSTDVSTVITAPGTGPTNAPTESPTNPSAAPTDPTKPSTIPSASFTAPTESPTNPSAATTLTAEPLTTGPFITEDVTDLSTGITEITSDAGISQQTSQNPSTSPPIITTTTQSNVTTETSSDEVNLGLILGLALGLGIPFIAGVIGGLIYYFKVCKPKQRVKPMNNTSNSTIGAATDIPLAPVLTPRRPIVSTSDQF